MIGEKIKEGDKVTLFFFIMKAMRQQSWLLATSLSKEWCRILFFSIPVALKENDRESDRPCSSALILSTVQTDQSDIATYYDE